MEEILSRLQFERTKQHGKWGEHRPQSLAGYIILIEKELAEAKEGYAKDVRGAHSAINELWQVAYLAIDCLERYGSQDYVETTNDSTKEDL